MVMVDIMVPSIGRQYYFSLEEQAPISALISEISGAIIQKEACVLEGSAGKLSLCSRERKEFLSPDASLSQYGIVNGAQLILI